jgi:hypothetical protein
VIVYVAGPYNAPTAFQREMNIRSAELVSLRVAQMGHSPICPHTMARHFFGELPEELAIRWCDDLLRLCEVVVLVPGWRQSPGTLREIGLAEQLGIRVVRSIHEL